MYGSSVGGALCPRHPDQTARGTCTRCGTFMCDVCSEGGTQPWCPDCRERTGLGGFPLHRGNWTFSALWDVCWAAFQREWVMLCVAVVVLGLVMGVLQGLALAGQMVAQGLHSQGLSAVVSIISSVLQNLITGMLTLGLIRMVYEVLLGQRADLGRLFSQLHKVGTYLLCLLLTGLLVLPAVAVVGGVLVGAVFLLGISSRDFTSMMSLFGVAGVLSVPLFIYFYLPLVFVQPVLAVEDGLSAVDILRRSYALARGQRLPILGVLLVAFLLSLAGFFACCVGLIPAGALYFLLLTGLSLALRPQEGEAL